MAGKAKTTGGLTPNMEVFATGLASGLSQAEAYRKAYPSSLKWADKTVWEQASVLAKNNKVSTRVEELLAKACEENQITVDKVLKRMWDIATADPNDIMQYRLECCRHCYGKDHHYQWRNEDELFKAEQEALADRDDAEQAQGKRKGKRFEPLREVEIPHDLGGYGFDPSLSPHAKCPNCDGKGKPSVFINDTRRLKGPAKVLYAGVKQTAQGIEIKVHDQAAHLLSVAKHLNMFTENLNVKDTTEHPILLLMKQIAERRGVNGSSLPVVENPPDDDEEDD
jgi:phage terminase small subunit